MKKDNNSQTSNEKNCVALIDIESAKKCFLIVKPKNIIQISKRNEQTYKVIELINIQEVIRTQTSD